MLPTLVIFARESLEASMIVAIILSYLRRMNRSDQIRRVWLGVAAALSLDLAGGILIFATIHRYRGTALQTILEGITYFVAAILLTTMSFWMKRHSRGLKHQLEVRMDAALRTSSGWALAVLAGVTVGREGLETVIFMLAVALQTQAGWLMAGAALGLLLGLGVSWWIYRLGRQVPLATFFNVFGVILLVFGAALIADGIENFQALGWLPIGQSAVWNTSGWLSESSALGDLLHTFVGYAASPSILQLTVYVVFITVAIAQYFRHPTPPRP
ncbi:MAG: FTR1 family protein [Thermaerobacter sp.]|nr:FTR1 family protein [Thermaerobacter sp.]